MPADSALQHFRGVHCRYCGKPVRIPGIVMKKDSECQGIHDASDTKFTLISRVFVLRCRSCEKESVYAINQIVDCAFAPPSAPDRLAQAAH